ncbi:MAG: thioesterase family protein [Planctomycetia bacterium]
MKNPPRIGLFYERTFTVEPHHLIMFADEQMPAVLSTPSLIAELERTAREAVAPLLEPHERTVGVEVNIRHLGPTVRGEAVRCWARVLGFDDGRLHFQVEALDGKRVLARGLHRRQVVDPARLKRLLTKLGKTPR